MVLNILCVLQYDLHMDESPPLSGVVHLDYQVQQLHRYLWFDKTMIMMEWKIAVVVG